MILPPPVSALGLRADCPDPSGFSGILTIPGFKRDWGRPEARFWHGPPPTIYLCFQGHLPSPSARWLFVVHVGHCVILATSCALHPPHPSAGEPSCLTFASGPSPAPDSGTSHLQTLCLWHIF